MTNNFLFIASTLFLLIGKIYGQYCTSDTRYTELQYFDSTEITIATNIQYGIAQDYIGNPDTLLMDLYYPNLGIDLSPKRPFIMLFHGGGFSSGDKASGDIVDLCVHLALRGFVCATVNYRLGHDFSEYGQYKARYRAIHSDLIANNICSEVTIDTTGGHGIYRNASSIFRANRASCFFKSIFCNNCINFYTIDSIPSDCSVTLGLDDNNFSSKIKIFPNPIENSFKIEGDTGISDLTIYNSFGQLVYKAKVLNGEVKVSLLPGIYFLTIRQLETNKTFTTKLIKN